MVIPWQHVLQEWNYILLMHVPVDADLMEDVPGLICRVILVQGDEELRQSLWLQLATLVAMSRKV